MAGESHSHAIVGIPGMARGSMSGWSYLKHFDYWTHFAHLQMEYEAVRRSLAGSAARLQTTGPPAPRAKLMDAVGLTEALGLPESDEEKVAKALKRFHDDNKFCGVPNETPHKGETKMIYRVQLVWPHLLENLQRWRPAKGGDNSGVTV